MDDKNWVINDWRIGLVEEYVKSVGVWESSGQLKCYIFHRCGEGSSGYIDWIDFKCINCGTSVPNIVKMKYKLLKAGI